MVRSMMSQTTLSKSFWDYALETAARILNIVPTKKVEKTPYEVWHGKAPKLSYLKVWGFESLVKRDTLTKPDKLEPITIKCIFIGYPKKMMGYSFYYPHENKVLVARNAEFIENSLITLEASGSLKDHEIIQKEDTHPSIDTSLNHEEDDLEIDEPQSDIVPIRRSTRTQHAPDQMQSMKDNEVWVLVELLTNGKTVGSKWLFIKKTDMDEVVHTYKTRLVAKGYSQTSRVDYEETFSPVADIRAIRILISIAAYYDYEIWQMDVKTVFLNGYLNEEVYMEQPEGVKSYLGRCFAMKDLGEAAYILGIKIYRDRSRRLIGLCQSAYIEKILKRYCMENFKRESIRMQEKLKLSKSQGASTHAELKRMQNVPYASAVGSIMYVVRCTCPDVAFSQNVTSRFQHNPDWICVRLNGGAVDWKSAKQSIFATSSVEAEYIAAFDASKEAVWVRKFISGLGVVPTIEEPISMYCDNTEAIAIANES
nr:retrotransposon protein, putative, Ty1-copia subclass [Tanacetum cinerariifolium]